MRCTVLLFALLAPATAAQKTWIVDANGGGQFLDIQPAVTAAQPGDTILVRAGSYSSFVVDRGVAVIGGPGVDLVPSSRTSGSISVQSVPAGQRAAIRAIGSGGATVSVAGCAGHVHLDGLFVWFGFSALTVSNSSSVSVRGTTVRTSCSTNDSTVAFSHSALATLTVRNSSVSVADSTVTGAIGPPILLESGRLTVAGDSATILQAQGPFPANAILGRAGSILVDPQVQLIPTTGQNPVGGNATVVYRTVPSLRITLSQIQLTTTLRAPGALQGLTLVGVPLDRPVVLPFGDVWLGQHLVVDAGPMPPNGLRAAALYFAPLPPGFTAVVQGVVAEPGGLRLSTPVVVTTG